jgi:AcrR family transcriptional regulator
MSKDAKTGRSRDRAGTEAMLIRAAREVLADVGFHGLGINAVARQAGCDKQLIYRYFGGLDGLVDAIGAEISDDLKRALQPMAALGQPTSYAELVERMLLGFLHVLRGDPLMQKIMAWEIANPSEQVQRLTMARSRSMVAWVKESRGTLMPPAQVDFAAINAVLLAAIQQLVLSGAAAGQFSGMPLTSEADWERVRNVIKMIVRIAFSDDDPK